MVDFFIRKYYHPPVGEEKGEGKSPQEYIEEVRVLIRRKTYGSALSITRDAMSHYPEDPFVLSYYGLLLAMVAKKHRESIKACKKSLKALKKSDYDKNSAYPTLYLNFGRAYLVSGDKNKAFDTFHKGLSKDHEYKDLIWELTKLGIRRPPVIPFLPRSFFINKYLGRLRHWILTR
jgi:tetratricopeptide (TPR) repeat protein